MYRGFLIKQKPRTIMGPGYVYRDGQFIRG